MTASHMNQTSIGHLPTCQLRNVGDGFAELVQGTRTLETLPWTGVFERVRQEKSTSTGLAYRDLLYQWASRDDVHQAMLRKAASDLHETMFNTSSAEVGSGLRQSLFARVRQFRIQLQQNANIGIVVLLLGVGLLGGSLYANRQLFMHITPQSQLSTPQKLEACSRMVQQQQKMDFADSFAMMTVSQLYQDWQSNTSDADLTPQQQQRSQQVQKALMQWRSKKKEFLP